MIRAIWDEAFKRSYRKKVKKNEDLRRRFWRKMELFLTSPFSPQLRTHKLSGKLEGQGLSALTMTLGLCLSSLEMTRCSL